MRHFIAIAALAIVGATGVANAAYPDPRGRVSDFADLYSAGFRMKLESQLRNFEVMIPDSPEIAVVTVKSLEGQDPHAYALALHQQWGVGKHGKNNGVLILYSDGEHKAAISTGFGVEGVLTDIECIHIIREQMAPRRQAGDYEGSMQAGVNAVIAKLGGTVSSSSAPNVVVVGSHGGRYVSDPNLPWSTNATIIVIILVILAFIFLIYLSVKFDLFGAGGYSSGSWSSGSSSDSSSNSCGGGSSDGGDGGGFGGGDAGGGGASGDC